MRQLLQLHSQQISNHQRQRLRDLIRIPQRQLQPPLRRLPRPNRHPHHTTRHSRQQHTLAVAIRIRRRPTHPIKPNLLQRQAQLSDGSRLDRRHRRRTIAGTGLTPSSPFDTQPAPVKQPRVRPRRRKQARASEHRRRFSAIQRGHVREAAAGDGEVWRRRPQMA